MKRAHLAALLVAGLAAAAALAEPPTAEVHRQLREIESAALRGEADLLRLKFQEQARTRPGDVLLRVYIAWCAMPSDDAWNQLKGIAQIYPDHRWARLGMARVYLAWKMRDQAETELKLALKADPAFYPALSGMGESARRAGKLDEALAHFQASLKLHDDPEAHAGVGLTLLAKGKTAEAKTSLERAIQLWPDQPLVLSELARLAREAQDLETAADLAEKLADLSPRDGAARKQLADVRYDAGQKALAAKHYELALRLGLVDVESYRRLAAIYREAKQPDDEQRTLEQLSVLERQVPDHALRLSELAEARGDLEAAEAQLLEALDRTPGSAVVLLRLARLRAKRENFREALDAYREALASKETHPEGLDAEAKALGDRFRLSSKPARGSVDAVYGRVAANLNAFYKARLKEKADLAGSIRIRVRVAEDGTVQGADLLEDSVGDPWLSGHAYFALKDAHYPKKKREPIFEFELRPPKGKK